MSFELFNVYGNHLPEEALKYMEVFIMCHYEEESWKQLNIDNDEEVMMANSEEQKLKVGVKYGVSINFNKWKIIRYQSNGGEHIL